MLSSFTKLYHSKNFLNFSKKFFTANTKIFKASTVSEGNKTISKSPSGEFEIKAPLDALLGCAGSCEAHMIQMMAKKQKVPIEKIEVDVKGEYDLDVIMGVKKGPNTYTQIDVETRIFSSEQDKQKLEQTVKKGMEMCPVLSTLKLAGIKITEKINFL